MKRNNGYQEIHILKKNSEKNVNADSRLNKKKINKSIKLIYF